MCQSAVVTCPSSRLYSNLDCATRLQSDASANTRQLLGMDFQNPEFLPIKVKEK